MKSEAIDLETPRSPFQVGRMVHAIKMGWMKPREEKPSDDEDEDEEPKYYQLWDDENEVGHYGIQSQLDTGLAGVAMTDNLIIRCCIFQSEINKRFRHHIPAPKPILPGHAESYNPPPEYLMTEEEVRCLLSNQHFCLLRICIVR